MRVISKLAQLDFKFGRISRQQNLLVIESDPDSKMPSTVYVSPQDVVEVLKRMLRNPGSLLFLIGLPFFLYRWNQSDHKVSGERRRRKEWPTV